MRVVVSCRLTADIRGVGGKLRVFKQDGSVFAKFLRHLMIDFVTMVNVFSLGSVCRPIRCAAELS